MRSDTADFRHLFLDDVPLLDVRAPVEFARGAFPQACNLPLMNDVERQKVGTCYQRKGQQTAIALGHELVHGRVKAARVAAWVEFARAHPDGYLYCFRGGLRSQLSQQWLKEAGIDYPRVLGGYKALRSFLIETLEQAVAECDFVVLGGLTGSGKTEVLAALAHRLDLEAHANHRGSSFGKRATGQPGQIDFENRLAIDLLRQRAAGVAQFVVEDESRMIGRCSLPLPLYQGLQRFPLVWLEDSLENRVQRIRRDYVIELCAEFVALHGPQEGFAQFAAQLQDSLENLARRLGGERMQRLRALLDAALAQQRESGATAAHRQWIEVLLREYYDPMYSYQREGKAARIEFSGTREQVIAYLMQRREARAR